MRDHRSPELNPKTTLTIVSVGGGLLQATIQGTLTFTDTHLWYMKRGTCYSLTAELWDDDDWTSWPGDDTMINDDDYCATFHWVGKGLQRLVWPVNPANPARTVSVFFQQNFHQSFLDRDPIGETEVFGRLMKWRDSGQGWVSQGYDSYTNVIHREFDGFI